MSFQSNSNISLQRNPIWVLHNDPAFQEVAKAAENEALVALGMPPNYEPYVIPPHIQEFVRVVELPKIVQLVQENNQPEVHQSVENVQENIQPVVQSVENVQEIIRPIDKLTKFVRYFIDKVKFKENTYNDNDPVGLFIKRAVTYAQEEGDSLFNRDHYIFFKDGVLFKITRGDRDGYHCICKDPSLYREDEDNPWAKWIYIGFLKF